MPTSGERLQYLDTSALVKLVVREDESAALKAFLGGSASLTSCALARVELIRAVRQHGAHAVATAHRLLDQADLIALDDELLGLAGDLDPPLRSLDAIHVAAAMELGDELVALVTYDERMARAASSLGLPVAAPV